MINRRILLAFLTIPTLVSASFWMVVRPVHAESAVVSPSVSKPDVVTPELQNCKSPQDGIQATAALREPQNLLQAQTVGFGTNLLDPIAELTFTDAESDAAVARFGCDCSRHIRAIQAMAREGLCVIPTSPTV